MGVIQLIIDTKHRKLRNFSRQHSPVYNQPLHTSSHVGRNNLLLVYASTMNPHPANITAVQPLTVDTGMTPRTAGQGPAIGNPSVSPTTNQYGQYFQRQTSTSSSMDRDFKVHTPSPLLAVSSNHTNCSTDLTYV
jgi:hypothetical protein